METRRCSTLRCTVRVAHFAILHMVMCKLQERHRLVEPTYYHMFLFKWKHDVCGYIVAPVVISVFIIIRDLTVLSCVLLLCG